MAEKSEKKSLFITKKNNEDRFVSGVETKNQFLLFKS
jgi:hypothetical protein